MCLVKIISFRKLVKMVMKDWYSEHLAIRKYHTCPITNVRTYRGHMVYSTGDPN